MREITEVERDKGERGLASLKAMSPEAYQRVRVELERAINNSVRHCMRSLLSHLTFMEDMARSGNIKPTDFSVFSRTAKRVHSDVRLLQDQILAAFSIYESGGYIPPFGRTEEELADAGVHGGRKSQDRAAS